MQEQQILLKLQQLPDELKYEVLDFIGYLLIKYQSSLPAQNNKGDRTFGKYRGCLNSGLSLDQLDIELGKMRSEWDRPTY